MTQIVRLELMLVSLLCAGLASCGSSDSASNQGTNLSPGGNAGSGGSSDGVAGVAGTSTGHGGSGGAGASNGSSGHAGATGGAHAGVGGSSAAAGHSGTGGAPESTGGIGGGTNGGAPSIGGAGGLAGGGGGTSMSGAGGAAAGAGGAASTTCKRGIASNAVPSSALAPSASVPGVSWWYDWSAKPATPPTGIEFVPMIWGSAALGSSVPTGAKYLLGFNEPNFKAQSNLTAQQAASDWPQVQASAQAAGTPIVSPAVNFCGSSTDSSQCSDPAVTDPYNYLKDFFQDCQGCQVDYIAVHWYNCDLPSLKAYIEGNTSTGGGLEGFTQFGKPIWLTEFACDGSHSVDDQKAYMMAAVPYLESNPTIFRYSWFSAGPIASALLMNADGSLTDLGSTYASLPSSCQ